MATSLNSILVLLFLSLSPLSFSQKCHPNDKRALLQIKKGLNNPAIISTWQPNTDCCSGWFGVQCDETTNRIIQFDLYETNLGLPIPAAVGDLPYLQSLTFHTTNVTGRIPASISKLSNLQTLDLRFNLLAGPVPAFIGNLKKLRYVGLTSNHLTGSIPASLSQVQELGFLSLEGNKLTGSIPESFVNFKQLYLYLADNLLSGPIPRQLGSADFFGIDVSRNKLEGDLSFMFGSNKSLTSANFSRNLFGFDLTNVKFPGELLSLDLSHNNIYGSLPKDMLRSTRIVNLDVSYNMLCGPIPQLRRNQSFDASVFSNNKCLCGEPLPKCK